MSRKMFVNLPVKNLPASRRFFEALGFSFNPQFSDDNGASMVISEENYAMLLTHDFFRQFTPREIVDARQATEVLIALSCEDRAEVDSLVSRAVAAGGQPHGEPKDHGFMYQHGFHDLDGHIWELFYMDPAHVQQ